MSDQAPAAPDDLFGHPRALPILFFAEMWERFCFYGMRALLTYYMVSEVFSYTDKHATSVYGSYNALIYLTPLLGGIVADRWLGYRVTILLGGLFMAIGQFTLIKQQEFFFYAGMAFMVVGNGLFKPNISTLVGKLYKDGDARRDAGFTIFYIGINLGALLATLICGYFQKNGQWTTGFGIAGVGMILGLITFASGRQRLMGHGEPPKPDRLVPNLFVVILGALALVPCIFALLQQDLIVKYILGIATVLTLGSLLWVAFQSEKVQRERMFVLLVLWCFHMMFWAFFEQAGTSLSLFTDRNVDRVIAGWEMPAAWGQFFNPFFILVFGSVFSLLWIRLSRIGRNPSIPVKFGLALLQAGAGFGVLVWAASWSGVAASGMVPVLILVLCYLLHTTGELCISPVGLSAVTKLAPKKMTGMVMGAWFLSISVGHKVAAWIAGETGAAGSGDLGAPERLQVYTGVFEQITYTAIGAGIVALVLSPFLKRWLHGVE